MLWLAACESYDPRQKQSGLFEGCCDGSGTCVPSASVPVSDAMQLGQDICEDALVCAPTGLAEDMTTYLSDTCLSFGHSEGRCLLRCLPKVAERAKQLQSDGCLEDALCVPCFDPVTSKDTGACKIGGDPGPSGPATPFPRCCAERGRCIPQSIVPADQRENLAAGSCKINVPSLCVPNEWVGEDSPQPTVCSAYGDAEGRCLSECLPDVARRASQLRADTCQPGQRCVPCYDPITGERTPACGIGKDAPQKPPRLFTRCCGSLGACVPSASVDAKSRPLLAQDSCQELGALCVPRDWATLDHSAPVRCQAYAGAEGRCLPSCLPGVAERFDQLQQSTCASTHMCVPCFDPVTGEDTGACTLAGDTPPDQPTLFPTCCGGRSRCVPVDSVAVAARSRLDADSCTGPTPQLCVPNAWLSEPPAKPARCHPYGDFEGRCLPDCLPQVESRSSSLRQATCAAGERCAPCYDPLTGADTGACTINGDAPGASRLFASCCGGIGACVPADALTSSDDRERLASSGCASTGGPELCAPKAWIGDERTKPTTCRAFGTVEGRCLPACLPDVASQADRLLRETCDEAYLCVPCFDPVTLKPTRACNIGQDVPQERPGNLAECCGGLGWCVPSDLVDAQNRDRLDQNTCAPGTGHVCAPADWVKSDRFTPIPCTAPGQVQGRCLPACLPDVAARSENLTASSCASGHLCVPCFDPVTGEDTRACSIGTDRPSTGASTYPACCDGGGLCVPTELIAGENRGELGRDSCNPNTSALCVPREWVGQDRPLPTTCRAYDGAEGRCLSRCLPAVASQRDRLIRDRCDADELCAPCYDPLDGHDTEACRGPGDAPVQRPYTFPACCQNLGRCIPTPLIDGEDRASLGPDSCGSSHLCAPNDWLSEPRRPPQTCHGHISAEGRCLPNCLPEVASQRDRLVRDVCPSNTSCAPCYDPVTGEHTAACTTGDDAPREPKRTFGNCCSNLGRCVPSGLVSAQDRGRLSRDNCREPSDALCVPSAWIAEPRTAPPSCRAPGNLEGRCLPRCLPDVAARADTLRQTSCGTQELCVPCYDPLTGQNTAACTTGNDSPREAPKRYPACCSSGTCVPEELLDDTSVLALGSCGAGSYCVPNSAANGQVAQLARCTVMVTSGGGAAGSGGFATAGACVNGCFVESGLRAVLSQNDCGSSAEVCVPCLALNVGIESTACD